MFAICINLATLFVAISLVASANVGGEKDRLLAEQICANTKHPSESLVTAAELRQVADKVTGGQVDCKGPIRSSISELNDLIQRHEKDVCSQASADDIAGYYRRYLAIKDEATNSLVEFPKALKKFFIAYGLKVSSFCRHQMADHLIADAQKLTKESDFEEVSAFVGQNKYIALFMGDSGDKKSHDSLELPENFVKMMQSIDPTNVEGHQKLVLQLSTTKRVNRFKAVCERRFRPIYKELILPLVTLSEAGFNYRGQYATRQPSEVKQVHLWYRIVFLCETMKKVEFVQASEDQLKGSQSDRVVVRVLDSQDDQQLHGQESALVDTEGVDLEQVEYRPQLESLPLDGTKLYDASDSKLEKAVMAFRRRTRKEIDPDVAHKLVNFVKDKAARGSIKLIGKLTQFKNLPVDGQLKGVDLVKALDDYAHALETGSSRSISAPPMSPNELEFWRSFFSVLSVLGVLAFCGGLIGFAVAG